MGRTFGFIIVSIGIWLIFSLPTRDAAVEQARGIDALQSLPGAPAAGLQIVANELLPSAGNPVSGGADQRAASVRQLTGQPNLRPNKAQEERSQAARNREIEAEPDPAIQRPPVPVAIAAATPQVSNGAAQAKGTAPQSQVASDTHKHAAPPVVHAIPPPVPVASPIASATLRLAQATELGKPAAAASITASPSAPGLAAKPTLPPATTIPAPRTSELAGAAIKAPRIFDTVRRDLAVPPVVAKSERVVVDKAAVAADQKSASATAGLLTKALPSTSKVAIPRKSEQVASSTPEQYVTKTESKRTASTSDETPAKPEPAKKPQRVAELPVRFESRPKQQVAAAPTPPPVPRQRIVQAYAPPVYVGRVTYRYTPPAVFVPSSGSARRAQFRGDSMWDSIRRSGM